MTRLIDLEEKWRKSKTFRAEYDALAPEFALADTLIRARTKARMTQEQVAQKMHTSQSYIAKLEGGAINPSLKALKRYADATGARLKISLESEAQG